ncbi:hypothetical protein QYF36_008122 [Acer negundo]|nr:hypothetical protein QYF36_008122 [Acer negundo]
MESVVATVSGYHGSERFNLIKLITQAGANYVGSMSRSTTHLVCWKFEGRKYELAKKFKMIIVNHRWVEDCVKHGKRISERHYRLQSGQEIGPLLLEIPLFTEKDTVSSDQSYSRDSEKEETDMQCGGSGPAVWTDSFLLKENLLPNFGKINGKLHESKPKQFKKTSKWGQRSSIEYCFQEPPLTGLVRVECEQSSSDFSIHSVRGKRKILMHEESHFHSSVPSTREKKISKDVCSTSLAKPLGKGRRLVKKSNGRDALESVLLESDQDEQPRTGGTSDDRFHNHRGATECFKDFEELEERNHPPALEGVTQDGCSESENLNGEVNDTSEIDHANRLPTSEDVSCAICWTEFSSTRGVLPCGHRFCYSCIQEWADHMDKMRKVSTCPLCKASFVSITKVKDAAASDQKIYSQTVPCALSTIDIVMIGNRDRPSIGAQEVSAPACSKCRSQEPVELLIICDVCKIRCIHSYCLDPPLFPWTCLHCQDLQMLYHRSY